MSDWINIDLLDKAIKSAEKGGALSTAAILFLGNIMQAGVIGWLMSTLNKMEHMRSKQDGSSIEARFAMAQALSKVADEAEKTRDRVERIETILDERLARRA